MTEEQKGTSEKGQYQAKVFRQLYPIQ